MMGVLLDAIGKLLMALEAGLIAAHSGLELVVGPFIERAFVVRGAVHLMAGQAGELLFAGAVDVTGRFQQAVVLAAGNPHHAIAPERAEFHLLDASELRPNELFVAGANGPETVGQHVPRTEALADLEPARPFKDAALQQDGVALAADFGGAVDREFGRVGDG